MNIFYAKAYGISKRYERLQQRIFDAAEGLGYRELPIYCSDMNTIEECDLNVQMHGSFSSFCNDAVLILQYPSGAGFRTDKKLVDIARTYHGANIIVLKYGYSYAEGETAPDEKEEAALLEKADLVVDSYHIPGMNDAMLAQKELIDAILAATYVEQK